VILVVMQGSIEEQHQKYPGGSAVRIHGLRSTEGAKLNGLSAVVLSFDSTAGRLKVRLRGPPPAIERNVKLANLTLAKDDNDGSEAGRMIASMHKCEFKDQKSREFFSSLRNSVVLAQEAEKQAGCDGKSLPAQRLYDLPSWSGGNLMAVSNCLATMQEKSTDDRTRNTIGISANADLRQTINSMTQYFLDGKSRTFIVMPSKHEGGATGGADGASESAVMGDARKDGVMTIILHEMRAWKIKQIAIPLLLVSFCPGPAAEHFSNGILPDPDLHTSGPGIQICACTTPEQRLLVRLLQGNASLTPGPMPQHHSAQLDRDWTPSFVTYVDTAGCNGVCDMPMPCEIAYVAGNWEDMIQARGEDGEHFSTMLTSNGVTTHHFFISIDGEMARDENGRVMVFTDRPLSEKVAMRRFPNSGPISCGMGDQNWARFQKQEKFILIGGDVSSGLAIGSQQNADDVDEVARLLASATQNKDDGNARFKAKDFDVALKHYTAAADQLKPIANSQAEIADDATTLLGVVLTNRAATYLALLDPNPALADAVEATGLVPLNAKAWYRKGQSCLLLCRNQEAENAMQAAVTHDPANEQLAVALAQAQDLNMAGRLAKGKLETVVDRRRSAAAEAKKGQWQRAAQEFSRVLIVGWSCDQNWAAKHGVTSDLDSDGDALCRKICANLVLSTDACGCAIDVALLSTESVPDKIHRLTVVATKNELSVGQQLIHFVRGRLFEQAGDYERAVGDYAFAEKIERSRHPNSVFLSFVIAQATWNNSMNMATQDPSRLRTAVENAAESLYMVIERAQANHPLLAMTYYTLASVEFFITANIAGNQPTNSRTSLPAKNMHKYTKVTALIELAKQVERRCGEIACEDKVFLLPKFGLNPEKYNVAQAPKRATPPAQMSADDAMESADRMRQQDQQESRRIAVLTAEVEQLKYDHRHLTTVLAQAIAEKEKYKQLVDAEAARVKAAAELEAASAKMAQERLKQEMRMIQQELLAKTEVTERQKQEVTTLLQVADEELKNVRADEERRRTELQKEKEDALAAVDAEFRAREEMITSQCQSHVEIVKQMTVSSASEEALKQELVKLKESYKRELDEAKEDVVDMQDTAGVLMVQQRQANDKIVDARAAAVEAGLSGHFPEIKIILSGEPSVEKLQQLIGPSLPTEGKFSPSGLSATIMDTMWHPEKIVMVSDKPVSRINWDDSKIDAIEKRFPGKNVSEYIFACWKQLQVIEWHAGCILY
jgi:tetratricopeptide (TPR) repeat protein